jgi:hypothetical protein
MDHDTKRLRSPYAVANFSNNPVRNRENRAKTLQRDTITSKRMLLCSSDAGLPMAYTRGLLTGQRQADGGPSPDATNEAQAHGYNRGR